MPQSEKNFEPSGSSCFPIFLLFMESCSFGGNFFCFVPRCERKGDMENKTGEKTLKQRIRTGQIRRQDVVRRLAELAFGSTNDCIRLALEEAPELDRLDLGLISEIKRNEKGTVEIKLLDRLEALQMLSQLAQEEDGTMEGFFQALQGGGAE